MNFATRHKTGKGFTLIELLVVIAIIGILAGIVLSALGQARAAARDAKRKMEIRQVQTAIEAYIAFNDALPGNYVGCDTSKGVCAGSCTTNCTQTNWDPVNSPLYTALVGTGLASQLPVDPTNNAGYYYYYEVRVEDEGWCTQFPTCPSPPCGNTCPSEKGCYEISVRRLERTNNYWELCGILY